MQFSDEDLLTTTEAARIVERSLDAVRHGVLDGTLAEAGRTDRGRPLVRRADLLAWDQTARRFHRPTRRWEATAAALEALGPATAEELGAYVGVHPGNTRKHLAILVAQGRAQRRPDGQWVLLNPQTSEVGQTPQPTTRKEDRRQPALVELS